ncbi:TIGR03749 family integrating conjugative element protein [Pseudomonas sp. MYb185]|uniref:TIGR03749 family integrating conjugative element protein n=1 Tax=Pseudomonas sp. MYb185 TaxID=1848729 RepID=UPI000CFBB9C8|nr:TIGR03749 family integrating conjugative element protein [Pseudomonas sp. MYb185]PRB81521.1 TIGR03749 family integrating conjugative element protein [Pseudomonas sp. MYb185]
MKMRLLKGLVCGALLAAPLANAVELMEWDRTPLVIDLPVGQERLVVLNRNVSVGLPLTIAHDDILRVQSTGGVLYFKAHEAFDTERVQLKDESTGEIILVDLTAKADASAEQIQVISAEVAEADASERPDPAAEQRAPLPVVLTRYVAQSLYSPLRVIEPVPGINRVAMRLPGSVETLLPALPVEARPIAAWTLEGLHATAIELRNQDPDRSFELDPRYLHGALMAATFMHPTIGPRGHLDDTTTIIIVTRGPLAEHLQLPRFQPTVGEG